MSVNLNSVQTEPMFTIRCKDIMLREFSVDDLDPFHEITWQPEIVQFLPDWKATKEQRREWMLNYEIPGNMKFLNAVAREGHIGEHRLCLAIISIETGEFIGWICSGMKDELPHPNREIMYAISNKHTNKGYATQAVNGMIHYLFQYTDVSVLNAIALVHNLASNKVIQKCGFSHYDRIEIDSESYHYYLLRRSDWMCTTK